MCNQLSNHPLWWNHPNVGLPAPLNLEQLFNADANQEMWLETGLEEEDVADVPRYLYDNAVKSGIGAMLMRDRTMEEEGRLMVELGSMIDWTSSSLHAVENAISMCTGVWDSLF